MAEIAYVIFARLIHYIFSFSFALVSILLCYCCSVTLRFCLLSQRMGMFGKKIAADSATFQLSPIVFGIVLTLIILASYCFVRIYISRRQQKNDTTIDSSKQSSSLLCNGVGGSGGSTGASNAVSMDTTQKVSI